MKKIPLTQGLFALIDDEDFKRVNQHKWHVVKMGNHWYAETSQWISSKKKCKNILMHRLIMGLKSGDKKEIDHINHNGLNNKQNNLRVCTRKQNRQNNKARGYIFYKGAWNAYIYVNNKSIHLGRFKTKKEAKEARHKAEIKYFGKFAKLGGLK